MQRRVRRLGIDRPQHAEREVDVTEVGMPLARTHLFDSVLAPPARRIPERARVDHARRRRAHRGQVGVARFRVFADDLAEAQDRHLIKRDRRLSVGARRPPRWRGGRLARTVRRHRARDRARGGLLRRELAREQTVGALSAQLPWHQQHAKRERAARDSELDRPARAGQSPFSRRGRRRRGHHRVLLRRSMPPARRSGRNVAGGRRTRPAPLPARRARSRARARR